MKQNISPTQKTLNLWAVILIVWSIYRAKFRTDLPVWFDEFIAKPFVFILPIYYYIKAVEKKPFFTSLYLRFTKSSADLGLGVVLGLAFFLTGAMAHYAKYNTLIPQDRSLLDPNQLLLLVGISIATSVTEEILSRGFVLKRLYEESKNMFTSSFLASILFFFIHVPILFTSSKLVGNVLLRVMVTDLVLSLAISFVFLMRKNLLIPIIIHAFYNLSLYLFM